MIPPQTPSFTILSPSFNQGEFIESTIQSILDQNYPNLEHIVIDGGSADSTTNSLRSHEKLYNLRWLSEPDNGIYDALNKGLKLATSEWIGWLNCDDLYPDGLLENVARAINENPDSDIICGDAEIFTTTPAGEMDILYTDHHYHGKHFLPTKQNLKITHLNACFFRKTLLDNVGEFNSDYKIIGDRDLMFRIMKLAPRNTHLNRVSCRYRAHAGSITMSSVSTNSTSPVQPIEHPQTAEMLRLTETYASAPNTPPEIILWCKNTQARLHAGCAAKEMFAFNFRPCFTEMLACLESHKTCPYYLFRSIGHRLKCSLKKLLTRKP